MQFWDCTSTSSTFPILKRSSLESWPFAPSVASVLGRVKSTNDACRESRRRVIERVLRGWINVNAGANGAVVGGEYRERVTEA